MAAEQNGPLQDNETDTSSLPPDVNNDETDTSSLPPDVNNDEHHESTELAKSSSVSSTTKKKRKKKKVTTIKMNLYICEKLCRS